MEFIKDYRVRRWLYGIATAVLVVLGGYGIISAQEQENFTRLIVALLNIGGAGVTLLAERNTHPPVLAEGSKNTDELLSE